MGLFGILKSVLGGGGNTPGNRVYRNRMAEYKGLRQRIVDSSPDSRIWILAHFVASLDEAAKALEVMQLAHRAATRPEELQFAPQDRLIIATTNVLLNASTLPQQPSPPTQILITEHYPTPGKDAQLVEILQAHAPEAEIQFYVNLDEPFFKAFGQNVSGVMDQVDAPEDEALEHPLLDHALRAAQKKIESKAKSDRPARSQEEWFELNMS